MIKYTKLLVGALTVGVMFAASCKKEEDNSAKAKLTGEWKMTHLGSDANNNQVMEATEVEALADSEATTYTFSGDGTGVAVIGLFGSPITANYTWKLLNNDQDIEFTTSSDVSTSHIQSLSSTDLIIKDTAGTSATWSVFKKQ